jgi:hypothetical protein
VRLNSQFKKLFFFYFLILFVSASFTFSQNLQPAPQFQLLNTGYGAAALGMGGAYNAIARDLTAIYWNPAGLAQLPGLSVYGDYSIASDSDEDYAAEVLPDRFDSAQRFEAKGSQFDFAGVSYAIQSGTTRIVPAFAWHHTSLTGSKHSLKETAGVVSFFNPTVFFQSEGTFDTELKHPDEEYSFGLAASVNNRIMIGGSINFPGSNPQTLVNGNFHESFIDHNGTARSDVSLHQKLTENTSGTSFRVGFLFLPSPIFSFGGTMRFPYTRSADLTLERSGTTTQDGITQNFTETATATSETDIPFEWSVGAAAHFRGNILLSGSVTYANYENSQQIIRNSSDRLLIKETTLPFPALRENAGTQHALLQWRGGIEYHTGQGGRSGLVLRSGIFRDGQPYNDEHDGNGVNFTGYTFGGGYGGGGTSIDVGFVREKGEIAFTPASQGLSEFSYRRFFISLSWAGQ